MSLFLFRKLFCDFIMLYTDRCVHVTFARQARRRAAGRRPAHAQGAQLIARVS